MQSVSHLWSRRALYRTGDGRVRAKSYQSHGWHRLTYKVRRNS